MYFDENNPPHFHVKHNEFRAVLSIRECNVLEGATEIRDTKKFRNFYLDGWPTIAWDCGFDLSPETLYEIMTGCEPRWVNFAGSVVATF